MLSEKSIRPGEGAMSDPRTITRLLQRSRNTQEREKAFEALIPLVYDDLKRLARRQLLRMRAGETLDATALAHESYLKLKDYANLDWADRQHFFAIAARAMRQILVDYARRRKAGKRYGKKVRVELESVIATSDERAEQILHINQLLERLEMVDVDLVQVVECRFFAGYSQEETASILDIGLRTVQRRWQRARGWLREFEFDLEGNETDRESHL